MSEAPCCWAPVAPPAETWNPQPRVATLEQGAFLVLEACGFLILEEEA
jgi:hypothetical protein